MYPRFAVRFGITVKAPQIHHHSSDRLPCWPQIMIGLRFASLSLKMWVKTFQTPPISRPHPKTLTTLITCVYTSKTSDDSLPTRDKTSDNKGLVSVLQTYSADSYHIKYFPWAFSGLYLLKTCYCSTHLLYFAEVFSLLPAIKLGSSLSGLEFDTRRVKWKRNKSPCRVTGGPVFWTRSPHTHRTLFCYHLVLCQLHSDQPECFSLAEWQQPVPFTETPQVPWQLDLILRKHSSRGKAGVEGCFMCLLESFTNPNLFPKPEVFYLWH